MIKVKIISLAILVFLPFLFEMPTQQEKQEENKNYLSVESLNLKVPVVESYSLSDLESNVVVNFHPNIEGNTVIYGHRFTNRQLFSSAFLNLSNLKLGERIGLFWKGKNYEYVVFGKEVVYPDENWILSESKTPILTLITCTPLYNPVMRLIIFARLLSSD